MGAHARTRSRRRKGGINWERFGRVALVFVLFGIAFSYLNPVMNFVHAWQGSKSTKTHLAELQTENQDLRRQAAEDSSDATLVREARRLGMVRPGERAWTVKGLPGR